METFKIVVTVLIALLMFAFGLIWVSTSKERQYNWVWFAIESVYICSLFAIWG